MCEWRQELPCIWFSDAAERPFVLAHIYLVAKLLWSWILDAEARPYNWWLNFRGSSWTVLWRMMGSQRERLVLGSVKQWSWLQQVYGRNLCTDLHKQRFYFFNVLSNKKSSMFVDCRRICLPVFLIKIWSHLESSYRSRYAPTRGISADSILKSVMYNVLDAALQNLKVLSDASLRACAMRPQRFERGPIYGTGLWPLLKIVCQSEKGFQSKAADVSPREFIVVPRCRDPLCQKRGIISARCSR